MKLRNKDRSITTTDVENSRIASEHFKSEVNRHTTLDCVRFSNANAKNMIHSEGDFSCFTESEEDIKRLT